MDLKEIRAWLDLGFLDKKQVIVCASDLLVKGYDTPNLRLLAGLNENSDEMDVREVLNNVFKEMDVRENNNKKEAGLALAKRIAKDILDQHISPYEGAKKIWKVWNKADRPKELIPFVNDVDDYEETYYKDAKILDHIVQEAKKLIN